MADPIGGSAVGRPLLFATEECRAVHSWSRISTAGQSVLLEALQILSPSSRSLSETQELMSFLQELQGEGHRPTVLRSKDVYGYRSCMSQLLPPTVVKPLQERSQRPTAKRRGRKPTVKKKEVHPSWTSSEKSNPRIKGTLPLVLLDSRTSSGSLWAAPPQQCLRLTNIQGASGGHTARLQVQANWATEPLVPLQSQIAPSLSGIPAQPWQDAGTAVALFSQRSLSCPIRLDGILIGDSAPVLYSQGRALVHTNTELTSNGWRGGPGGQRPPHIHRDASGPPVGQRSSCRERNGLRSKIIKVDDSRSVDEARRKAQKILQVNLSPVIQIQPVVFRDVRLLNGSQDPPHH